MFSFQQYPEPGRHLLRYSGDVIEFKVTGKNLPLTGGKAFLSTNIGNAATRRNEIVEEVEERITAGGADWTDIPMERVDDYTFVLRLALTEPGHYECKCSYVPEEGAEPYWAEGDNIHLNVEPAAYCCQNSVYCAFVRQFGPNKEKPFSTLPDGITKEELQKFDDHDFALIPVSGTFRDLIGELDHIVNKLKCRIIHLLPVNPTPTVYGRMGRYGSPYAALDFTAVDPALAQFDRKATPLDQFLELSDAIHAKDAKLFIDIAINHTGWAAKLHETNPDWLVRENDGTIHSPGAWGVTWGDLTELDHSKLDLWEYLADMFLIWCKRGVDGFRCDAGYMIPVPAWEYIIARVRREYPETIFLLEGLGGDPAVTRQLLDAANMNWAYSELFQNYSREQVEGYLRYAWNESSANGLMIHYAETHDNNRLAAISHTYAAMRTALSALSSVCGAFGFANGVEWFAKEKIDVHESSALNWGAEENQVELIARLNLILAIHPAFHAGAMLTFIDSGSPDGVLFLRTDSKGKDSVLVAVNLNCSQPVQISWSPSYMDLPSLDVTVQDLISGKNYDLCCTAEGKFSIMLPAGRFAALALNDGHRYLDLLSVAEKEKDLTIGNLRFQAAKAMALRMIIRHIRSNIMPHTGFSTDALAEKLLEAPEKFMAELPHCEVVRWNWPEDTRREVMLPPDHTLFVTAPHRFRCTVNDGENILYSSIALQDESDRFFVMIPPLPPVKRPRYLQFNIRVFAEETTFSQAKLLQLPEDISYADVDFSRSEIYNRSRTFLQANGRGAIIHQQLELEKMDSRYDAILLANLNPDFPVDRHIMWRRIRVWMVWHARRQEIKHEHLHSFCVTEDGGGCWEYHVPAGNGLFVELIIKMELVQGENAVIVTFHRKSVEKDTPKRLPDTVPVMFIVRPDLEDRNFHYNTKAAQGPENYWPALIKPRTRGFDFEAAPDRILSLECSQGTFTRKDAWIYMNWMANEAARGLDPHSDLYCPGAFKFSVNGGETACLSGQILRSRNEKRIIPMIRKDHEPFRKINNSIEHAALHSLNAFVVKRDDLKTVIAGYPWFLDWGRDTLIAARGLIAAERFREDVKKILVQFARFEQNGTIPNMISGANADNRDTSDAPLWLFTAAADLCRAEGSYDFLNTPVRDSETFRDVLTDLADGICRGTPNGIRCDLESGLVFSPPHFTWMDTNYPAGTPREGYPVEIQALWFAALSFLGKCTGNEKWSALAAKVKNSIRRYFLMGKSLSDCLHCSAGMTPAQAIADDHIRPNQLLAVTLGAVDDPTICNGILEDCACLLIPGAIRSLADRKTAYALPVKGMNGQLLNDPHAPYCGRYEGDEDTRRKVAYHNGTAWTWQFPLYAEAYFMTRGEPGKATAKAYLASMVLKMDSGCVMQLPEILDGDAPHISRGCDAQAWGISEFYRVWKMLHS